jgi:hypothetical protein
VDAAVRVGDWKLGGEYSTGWRYLSEAADDGWGRRRTLTLINELQSRERRFGKNGELEAAVSFTLYDGRRELVLSCGFRNGYHRAVLLHGFQPMVGGRYRPADVGHRRPVTLDGHGALGAPWKPGHIPDSPREAAAGESTEIPGLGANAIRAGFSRISENNLLLTYTCETGRHSLVAGGLTYAEFLKQVHIREGASGEPVLSLIARDPVGVPVAPGAAYLSRDAFILDFEDADPFQALERYADRVARAQGAAPNDYNFPTLDMWYVMVTSQDAGTDTATAVERMQRIVDSDFTRFSPAAVRLIPDTYLYETGGDTSQGWWDDEHWRKFGFYRPPYETTRKFCEAIRKLGGIPFSYVQTGMPADDFAARHPEWMLGNRIQRLKLAHNHEYPTVRFDYSDRGFQEYLAGVWKRLGEDGLEGVMFDYPETGFAGEGGMEDPGMSATAAYRKIYGLCREGLGPDAWIHERNLGYPSSETVADHQRLTYTDATAGVVDSQRLETDSSSFAAAQVARAALRWYKSRRLFTYDMDSKSLLFRVIHSRETEDIPNPRIRRRSILTMLYVTGCRVLLADDFGDYTPEIIHELSRLYPLHAERRTARPVDIFLPSGRACPRVFDYVVDADWHQLALFNPDDSPATVVAPLAAAALEGGLGLDPDADYFVYDFWNQRLIACFPGESAVSLQLESLEARMLSVRKRLPHPQVLSTDRHLMQGLVELSDLTWDGDVLSGKIRMAARESIRIVIARNGHHPVAAKADCRNARLHADPQEQDDLMILELESEEAGLYRWQIPYEVIGSA